jgi:hypothetical protein
VAGVEPLELFQHPDEAVGVVGILLQVKAQPGLGAVGVIAERGRHGGPLPGHPVTQDQRTSLPGPGAAHRWDQRDARLVEEDKPGRFCAGPFLIRGHSC